MLDNTDLTMLHEYTVVVLLNVIVFIFTFVAYYWMKKGVRFKEFALQYGKNFAWGFVTRLYQNWIVYPAALATREWMVASNFVTDIQLNSMRHSMTVIFSPIVAAFMLYKLFSSPRDLFAFIMGLFTCKVKTNEE